MKEIGLIHKEQEMENILMLINLFMKDNGMITFKMVKENFSI